MGEQPAGVTLVVGPEELLVERGVAGAVAAARAAASGEIEVTEIVAAGAPRGVLADALSPSLFEERKVVVVHSVQDAGEALVAELQDALTAPPDHASLVLVHDGKQGAGGQRVKRLLDSARQAGAAEVSCAPLRSRRDKLRFLQGEMRGYRRKATEEALEVLLDALGADLRALAGACSQLVADTEGVIDAEVVRRYYAGHAEMSGFTVADSALDGRAAEALEQLRWAVQSGLDPVPIVAALAAGLRNLVKVAQAPRGLAQADLARAVGLPPWKVDVVRRQVRGWDAAGVGRALVAVAEADAQVKGAGTDAVYAVEKALVAVTRARSGG